MGKKQWKISKTRKEIFSLKVLTRTCGSTSCKSTVASTSDRSYCIGTCCTWMTIMGAKSTFIVVWMKKENKVSQCKKGSNSWRRREEGLQNSKDKKKKHFKQSNSPEHVVPIPVNPLLQAQVKEPSVLAHVAFEWQLCVPSVHSLLSE